MYLHFRAGQQHLGELITGELRPLIGIEDAGLAEPGEGLAQRLGARPGVR
jgi:hypothetical protein